MSTVPWKHRVEPYNSAGKSSPYVRAGQLKIRLDGGELVFKFT
jgi:hypothetical protein